jgi:hypothetical protein
MSYIATRNGQPLHSGRQNNTQQSINKSHTNQLKSDGELGYSGMIASSCFTRGT